MFLLKHGIMLKFCPKLVTSTKGKKARYFCPSSFVVAVESGIRDPEMDKKSGSGILDKIPDPQHCK
jgi:hypothetical protein